MSTRQSLLGDDDSSSSSYISSSPDSTSSSCIDKLATRNWTRVLIATVVILGALVVVLLLHLFLIQPQPESATTSNNTSFSISTLPIYISTDGLKYTTTPSSTDYESQLRALLAPQTTNVGETIKEHLAFLSNYTHLAGSIRDYQTALYVQKVMKDAGLPNVELEQHAVLLSHPVQRSLALTFPLSQRFTASLQEDAFKEDPTSFRNDVPTYLAYAANGTLSGRGLVYVKYCLRSDFDYLVEHKINMTGRVCLCRYGSGWRGDKVSLSHEFGCAATLIYSDPFDDGFARGPVFPQGPWKPREGVQRGSIMNSNGDALTPDWPSGTTADEGYRITLEQARGPASRINNDVPLPQIPALPISWGDALPLLQAMTGPNAPAGWIGSLNVTYRLGGNDDALVDMTVMLSDDVQPIWNVVATIDGIQSPQQQVLMGSHRDSWTFGAVDPTSGTISLLALAQGLGSIYQSGWRPARTMKLISWDGEEQGLIGSVEYCDEHEHTLLANGVAYINLDTAVTGFDELSVAGTPIFSKMVAEITRIIPAPLNASSTLYDEYLKSKPIIKAGFNHPLVSGIAGTGSDNGAFVQRMGVPSMDLGYSGSGYSGVYHTSYDSFYWQMNFGDGKNGFAYHAAMSQFLGSLAIRMSDAVLLPFTLNPYAVIIADMFAPLGRQGVAAFPTLQQSFTSMNNSLQAFHTATVAFDAKLTQLSTALSSKTTIPSPATLALVNSFLSHFERYFLYMPGIQGRAWYRSLIWCTSLTDGYSGDGLALIQDGILLKKLDDTARALWLIQHALMKLTEEMNRVLAQLG